MSPVTLVKTRMEYGGPDAPRYRSTWHALRTIAAAEGARGLFRGLVPTVVTNAPFSALYYAFYTKLKHAASTPERPQALVNFISGVAAATAATLLTQPTDVLRTRVQLGLGLGSASLSGAGAAAPQAGAWATLGHVLRTQGPGALLAGEGGVGRGPLRGRGCIFGGGLLTGAPGLC
jgi:solute carrier family 25 protein 38